jgi:hypothetical protein
MIDKIWIWRRLNALKLDSVESLLLDGREDKAYHLFATLLPIINAETVQNDYSISECRTVLTFVSRSIAVRRREGMD